MSGFSTLPTRQARIGTKDYRSAQKGCRKHFPVCDRDRIDDSVLAFPLSVPQPRVEGSFGCNHDNAALLRALCTDRPGQPIRRNMERRLRTVRRTDNEVPADYDDGLTAGTSDSLWKLIKA